MKKQFWPVFYVTIQFSCLIFTFVSAPLLADSTHLILLEMAGIFLGVLAILQMGVGNFNIRPVPKSDSKLVITGVYQWIRHPMYLAQLLVVLALVVDYYSLSRLATLLILIINLIFKLHYEERRLLLHFSDYEEYKRNSWRLFPYIF